MYLQQYLTSPKSLGPEGVQISEMEMHNKALCSFQLMHATYPLKKAPKSVWVSEVLD